MHLVQTFPTTFFFRHCLQKLEAQRYKAIETYCLQILIVLIELSYARTTVAYHRICTIGEFSNELPPLSAPLRSNLKFFGLFKMMNAV